MTRLISVLLLFCSTLALADEEAGWFVLGTITSSKTENSVALIGHKEHGTITAKVGRIIDGARILSIQAHKVTVEKSGIRYLLKKGDFFSIDPVTNFPKITDGLEVSPDGTRVRMTTALRDFIKGVGLATILMQVGVTAKEDRYGDQYGYMLYRPDAGSVYDIGGLEHRDIVTEIDGTSLETPLDAILALRRIKTMDKFSFVRIRNGQEETITVEIQ